MSSKEAAAPDTAAAADLLLAASLPIKAPVPRPPPYAPGKGKGKGKGGKGVSKAWQMRRYINRYHPNTNAFTRPALRRLCRRGGVKRISHASYSDQARTVAYDHVRSLVKDAVTYADHAGRKTVMAMDVVMAVKRQGGGLWGFGY